MEPDDTAIARDLTDLSGLIEEYRRSLAGVRRAIRRAVERARGGDVSAVFELETLRRMETDLIWTIGQMERSARGAVVFRTEPDPRAWRLPAFWPLRRSDLLRWAAARELAHELLRRPSEAAARGGGSGAPVRVYLAARRRVLAALRSGLSRDDYYALELSTSGLPVREVARLLGTSPERAFARAAEARRRAERLLEELIGRRGA